MGYKPFLSDQVLIIQQKYFTVVSSTVFNSKFKVFQAHSLSILSKFDDINILCNLNVLSCVFNSLYYIGRLVIFLNKSGSAFTSVKCTPKYNTHPIAHRRQ